MINVAVQGLGFVGCAMSVAIASRTDTEGQPLFNVIGVDLPTKSGQKKIHDLNNGIFPFRNNDKKLSIELGKAVERGNLTATDDKNVYSDVSIIIVSINCDLVIQDEEQKIDLDSFSKSISEIAHRIVEETLVIIESTVPPGTCEKIVYPIFENAFKRRKLNIQKFYLAHSYERVTPGSKYLDSIVNYWRVFSGINDASGHKCATFLSKVINTSDYPLTRLENTTASETGKLLENSYRAVNIAFIDEWSRFAEDVGIDLYEILQAISLRPTHSNIRQPGFGVGGYCLTKDPLFAKIAAKDLLRLNGHQFPFSTRSVETNKKMPFGTLEKIKNYFEGDLEGRKLLVMGITYKPDIGDTRFSPSEIFFRQAILLGAEVDCYDPMIEYWDELQIDLDSNLPKASDYDAVIFAVAHKEFANIAIEKWLVGNKTLIFDANNVLTENQVREIKKYKLNYQSVGRG